MPTTERYATQAARWPKAGRHILARYDANSIVVYQAYKPSIGHFAAAHGRFGGEFSFDRMSWVFFPIQMAVVLSPIREALDPEAEGFQGGEFLFCDVPEGKKSRRRVIPAGLGDAVLFCTRDRLVRVGGAHGLQPVKHGVNEITEGSRLVLGVPFHEYR